MKSAATPSSRDILLASRAAASSLVSASRSRLARQMRPHLGWGLWEEFVEFANKYYKAAWLRALPG